ncbi:MAG: Beta-lactamase class C-like and penicillin binding proteins (PBPs) superfamily [uncultured Cytophagales bacterium]|uniref:Beta-lactamase class C-like and penicillin binding proteins (PBPs) superfamily n=1 Tax=uncultured Cytophagales bacterium TaxID=158755 RepID=A0A6J4LKZ0_9SPHI|nr:MAG: Beta-lactamase class C-like and penicillin binding proteins (PBPs) superfamily [uncultured Cytophagales bacterium]
MSNTIGGLFLIGLVLLTANSQEQQAVEKPVRPKPANSFEEIDRYLQAQVDTAKASPVAGIALAIVEGQRLVHAQAFGVSSLATKQTLQAEHNFHIASISKTFAAAAILQLMEQGKLDIEQKLVTYLPYFKLADKRYRDITLKQILNHTSGMPDVEDYQWEQAVSDEGAAERWTRSLTKKKLRAAPGKEFYYSNLAYDVLADVVAKVSGTSFEHYVKENLLAPLQMHTSSFLLSDISPALRTSPHSGIPLSVNRVYPYNRMHAASSTMNSNVVDLSHWIMANLNKGVYQDKQVLSPQSIALMQTPSFTVDVKANRRIGLNWFIVAYQGETLLHHDGADEGYVSTLYLVPSRNIGFVLLFNSDEVNSYAITEHILQQLLARYPKNQH